MNAYLIHYAPQFGPVEIWTFKGESAGREARRAQHKAMKAKPDLEHIVLYADHEKTIRRNHPQYFAPKTPEALDATHLLDIQENQ